ncbi:hypothetical protein MPER_07039, partial [Moniliophthora perniciosa FA553]
MELCGKMPPTIALGYTRSSDFFNSSGELKNIQKLRYWPLDEIIRDKYRFSQRRTDELKSFLGQMLKMNPTERAKAGDLACHSWLANTGSVLGEVDARSRIEQLEKAALAAEKKNERQSGWGIIDSPGRGNDGGPLGYVLGGVGGTTVLGLIGMIGSGGSIAGTVAGASIGGIEGSMAGGGAKVPPSDEERLMRKAER